MAKEKITEEDVKQFKIYLTRKLQEVSNDTSFGYFYNFNEYASIIDNGITGIILTDDILDTVYKQSNKVLMLDSRFNEYFMYKLKNMSIPYSKEDELDIRFKELGINLLADQNINPNLVDSIALYFASKDKETKQLKLNYRRLNTKLPFFDLRLNIIKLISMFVSEETLAGALKFGTTKLNDEIEYASGGKISLRDINSILNNITIIQDYLNGNLSKYHKVDGLHYEILNAVNKVKERENIDNNEDAIKYISNSLFADLDLRTVEKITKVSNIYDQIAIEHQIEDNNANFYDKTVYMLNLYKSVIEDTLLSLDKTYIEANDFLVKKLVSKGLDLQGIDKNEVLETLDYQVLDNYNYLEESKISKKLQKKITNRQ